jgi:hypothetical protein
MAGFMPLLHMAMEGCTLIHNAMCTVVQQQTAVTLAARDDATS